MFKNRKQQQKNAISSTDLQAKVYLNIYSIEKNILNEFFITKKKLFDVHLYRQKQNENLALDKMKFAIRTERNQKTNKQKRKLPEGLPRVA